ncbi:hypothetical protein K503DRAFT_806947 [Rhizopogon vinicolor AM-OR11-026]|uniref:Autophagy-related protein n=1 Tax=Rhizopogon vinicolor AM-OR11-026 TaxID=1314800 RepID=A0A1B7MDG0_9AGAM|nr:hypothetical protein K503DRAFT_806947 [Rhizopogon vinicolor AM-OR11-026]
MLNYHLLGKKPDGMLSSHTRYGLFSITDKSNSFVGPLIVGLIADSTGNIRCAFFFLVFMVWAAVPVLLSVNVDKGRQDVSDYVSRRALVEE